MLCSDSASVSEDYGEYRLVGYESDEVRKEGSGREASTASGEESMVRCYQSDGE